MNTYKIGSITITFPDSVTIPERAGKLSKQDVLRVARPREGIAAVCEQTVDSLRKYPDRLVIPGVSPEALESAGERAKVLSSAINDARLLLRVLTQARLLLSLEAFGLLRRVLRFVRAEEAFDARIADLVPELVDYFSRSKPEPEEEEEETEDEEAEETEENEG